MGDVANSGEDKGANKYEGFLEKRETETEEQLKLRILDEYDETFEDGVNYYSMIAQKYDHDMGEVQYSAPEITVTHFVEQAKNLNFSKDCRILDMAAGTGKVGDYLKHQHGFTNIEAADAVAEMLEVAKSRDAYTAYHVCRVGEGHTLPMADDTYDVVLVSGVMGKSQMMKCDAIPEFVRVTKPGGLFMNVMREENTRKVEEYTKLLPLYDQLEAENKWKKVAYIIPETELYVGFPAVVQVYRITKGQDIP